MSRAGSKAAIQFNDNNINSGYSISRAGSKPPAIQYNNDNTDPRYSSRLALAPPVNNRQ